MSGFEESVREVARGGLQSLTEAEVKMMKDEFESEKRAMSSVTGQEASERDEYFDNIFDKQMTRKMMSSILQLFQQKYEVPTYARVGIGDGTYGITAGVNSSAFKNFVIPLLPDIHNSIGKFIRYQPVFNKKGVKLTEKMLNRRIEDMYIDYKPHIVRRNVEELCANIVIQMSFDKIIKNLIENINTWTFVYIPELLILKPDQADKLAEVLSSDRCIISTIKLSGNGLGSGKYSPALLNQNQKVVKSSTVETMNDLSRSPLDILVNTFVSMKTLQNLTISSNHIIAKDIPAIVKMNKLKSLSLPNNNLDNSAAQLFAESLPIFSNLQHLDLSRNNIKDEGILKILKGLTNNYRIPLKLTSLRLGYNKLGKNSWMALGAVIENSVKLRLLDVSGTMIPQSVIKPFVEQLITCTHLQVLLIASVTSDSAIYSEANMSGEGDEGVNNMFLKFVPVLNLQKSPISDVLNEIMGPVLKHLKGIQVLNVGSNVLSPLGSKPFANALGDAHSLRKLNLAWNDIRDKGIFHLSKAFKKGATPNLVELDISYNNIGKGMSALLDVIVQNQTNIEILILKGNNLSDDSLQILAEILNSKKCKITLLDISDVGNPKVWKFCHALSEKNRSIKKLSLSRNNISFKRPVQAEEFASKMLSSSSLTELDISFNHIADDGALAFARHLVGNKVLRSLDLSANGLTKPSAYGLARALSYNRVLETLNLRWNTIGSKGATALIDMMRVNRVLRNLDAAGFGVPFRLSDGVSVHGTGVFHMIDEIRLGEMKKEGDEEEEKMLLMRGLSDGEQMLGGLEEPPSDLDLDDIENSFEEEDDVLDENVISKPKAKDDRNGLAAADIETNGVTPNAEEQSDDEKPKLKRKMSEGTQIMKKAQEDRMRNAMMRRAVSIKPHEEGNESEDSLSDAGDIGTGFSENYDKSALLVKKITKDIETVAKIEQRDRKAREQNEMKKQRDILKKAKKIEEERLKKEKEKKLLLPS